MADQNITVFLEFSPDVAQQEIQGLEEALKHIQGVETDLQATRDPLATIILVVQIATSVGIVAGSIKSVYEVAEKVYQFLHRKDKDKVDEQGKERVVLKQGNKTVELYNCSLEEIKQLLSQKT